MELPRFFLSLSEYWISPEKQESTDFPLPCLPRRQSSIPPLNPFPNFSPLPHLFSFSISPPSLYRVFSTSMFSAVLYPPSSPAALFHVASSFLYVSRLQYRYVVVGAYSLPARERTHYGENERLLLTVGTWVCIDIGTI